MKAVVRRIGNSLGVLLPKPLLEAWGIREGDHLELSDRGLRPPRQRESAQERLDEFKRQLAVAVVREFPTQQIRAQSLANLHRWKRQGTWVSAYDEWLQILESGSDGALFAAMLGRDQDSNRLRQSLPFVGLLSPEQVKAIYEDVIGMYSTFHEQYGYYADPVDETTATLPKGWRTRLINLPPGDTEGVLGLCLDPHDLAIAKYIAGGDKDLLFNRQLISRGLLDRARLLELLAVTAVDEPRRAQAAATIAMDFDGAPTGAASNQG